MSRSPGELKPLNAQGSLEVTLQSRSQIHDRHCESSWLCKFPKPVLSSALQAKVKLGVEKVEEDKECARHVCVFLMKKASELVCRFHDGGVQVYLVHLCFWNPA
jgi:hypothetical protein